MRFRKHIKAFLTFCTIVCACLILTSSLKLIPSLQMEQRRGLVLPEEDLSFPEEGFSFPEEGLSFSEEGLSFPEEGFSFRDLSTEPTQVLVT